jgi:hypothetical protein
LAALAGGKLGDKDRQVVDKLLNIYFLGQLLDLPTLHAVLEQYGVKGNTLQIKYNKLLENMGHRDFIGIFESFFVQHIGGRLEEMCWKDPSVWSKTRVTAVLDDSVFKQWLKGLLGNDAHYGCFFSGQTKSTVYGFKVACFGLVVDGAYHPMFLGFVPKKTPGAAKKAAEGLVGRWGGFVRGLEKKGLFLPWTAFSCDNGYNDVGLSAACGENYLDYIGVPKTNHYFIVGGQRGKLSALIDGFGEKEAGYLQQCGADNVPAAPFTIRYRAYYEAQGREVVLLLFRLGGSKKITAVYTDNLHMFAKTLRRHWFDRTYIEQFFKLLKHSMKIQCTITTTKDAFENKLYMFMFLGLYLQLFVRHARKRSDFGLARDIGLEGLKRQLIFKSNAKDILGGLLGRPFAKEG